MYLLLFIFIFPVPILCNGNIILEISNTTSDSSHITLLLHNVNLSCGGTVSNVEITDVNGSWISYTSSTTNLYYFESNNLQLPASARITRIIHSIDEYKTNKDIITSLMPSIYDFGTNFCINNDTTMLQTTITQRDVYVKTTWDEGQESKEKDVKHDNNGILSLFILMLSFIVISIMCALYIAKRKLKSPKDPQLQHTGNDQDTEDNIPIGMILNTLSDTKHRLQTNHHKKETSELSLPDEKGITPPPTPPDTYQENVAIGDTFNIWNEDKVNGNVDTQYIE